MLHMMYVIIGLLVYHSVQVLYSTWHPVATESLPVLRNCFQKISAPLITLSRKQTMVIQLQGTALSVWYL